MYQIVPDPSMSVNVPRPWWYRFLFFWRRPLAWCHLQPDGVTIKCNPANVDKVKRALDARGVAWRTATSNARQVIPFSEYLN